MNRSALPASAYAERSHMCAGCTLAKMFSHHWDRLLKRGRSIATSTRQKVLGVAGGCSMGCKGSKAATAEPKLEIEVVDDTVSCVSFCNSPGLLDQMMTVLLLAWIQTIFNGF